MILRFYKFHVLLWSLVVLQLSCQSAEQEMKSVSNNSNSYVYNVKRSDHQVYISGSGEDQAWLEANRLSDFRLYWRSEDPPPTSFRALHDDQWLYLFYDVQDTNIKSKLPALDTTPAVHSDRVEIFFKHPDDSLPYYSLEMDCLGRLFDSKGEFGQYIDANWKWPEEDLFIATHITEQGYTLEARISKASLEQLDLIDDGQIQAGLYRADYIQRESGKREPRWISWVKPDSPRPNFHIPSSFGTLILEP